MLVGGGSREEVMVRLLRERSVPSRDGAHSPLQWFLLLVAQSGARSRPRQVAITMAVIAVFAALVLMAIFRSGTIAGLGAATAGLALPLLVLMMMRRGRWKRLTAQLPDAIDIVVRSLRAGHPISTSISMVAREMRDPIATEFGLVVDEMTYGLNLDDSLSNMARRVGHNDMRFLVVAVMIQGQVGGNLAEILSSLSRVIRERAKMRAKIRALSAEGRFSAILLSVLPFILMAVIHLIAPMYYTDVAADPAFWPVLGVGCFLMVLGIIVMYRLVNFRV
jgi:tight adherence protein B